MAPPRLKGAGEIADESAMATRPLEPRKAQRTTRHTSCELEVGGKSFTGVIVDLSATGLFVRTNIQPEPGSPVLVVMRRPGGEVWEVRAHVTRTTGREVTTPRRGLGLEIDEAPHAYHVFVSTLPQ